MTSTLFGLSFICYFLASVLYLTNLHVRHKYLSAYATVLTFVGFTLQTIRLVTLVSAGGFPFTDASEAMFFLSWSLTFLYLMMLAKFRLPVVGALALPIVTVSLLLSYRLSSIVGGRPVAGGQWLGIHVIAIVLSMAVFGLAFCCAVFYLVQNKLLKAKKMKGMFRKLPPLELVDRLGHGLAVVGLALLTLGIITGVVGVETSSLVERMSPVKIIISALTWAIYAAYLLARGPIGWRGKKANWILVAGVAAIALATGLHRFA
jgi:ABC-type uncharacterized transport system permease subunit